MAKRASALVEVSRRVAAVRVGVSATQWRRLERSYAVAVRVTESGAVLVSAQDVARVIAARPQRPGRVMSEGDRAAMAFAALDHGSSLADLVIRLRLTPAEVQTLATEWRSMRGSLVISAVEVAALRAIGVTLSTGSDVLAHVLRLRSELRTARRAATTAGNGSGVEPSG